MAISKSQVGWDLKNIRLFWNCLAAKSPWNMAMKESLWRRVLVQKYTQHKFLLTSFPIIGDLPGLEGCMGSHVRIGVDVVVVVGRHSFLLAYLIY